VHDPALFLDFPDGEAVRHEPFVDPVDEHARPLLALDLVDSGEDDPVGITGGPEGMMQPDCKDA
jgi:hypothetical protein